MSTRNLKLFSNRILDLWNQGFTATQIKRKLNLQCGRNHISNVVCRARARRDRRAVVHVHNGKIVGRRRPWKWAGTETLMGMLYDDER